MLYSTCYGPSSFHTKCALSSEADPNLGSAISRSSEDSGTICWKHCRINSTTMSRQGLFALSSGAVPNLGSVIQRSRDDSGTVCWKHCRKNFTIMFRQCLFAFSSRAVQDLGSVIFFSGSDLYYPALFMLSLKLLREQKWADRKLEPRTVLPSFPCHLTCSRPRTCRQTKMATTHSKVSTFKDFRRINYNAKLQSFKGP